MRISLHHLTILRGHRRFARLVPAIIAASAAVGSTQAQLVTFDTSGNTATQSIANTQNASLIATGVSGTPALSRTTLTASGGAAGSFFSNGAGNTGALDLTKDYVGFTVAPSAGNVLVATSINFTSQGSSTAPNSYAIAYSTDTFATSSQQTFTGTTVTSAVSRTYDIPDLITSDTLAVRLYNYGATSIGNGASSATGSYRVITPSVAGTTVATSAGAITLAAATEIRNANALTLGGVISGNFAVTKTGAGTLTLSGTSNYSGTTTVSAGTLLLSSTGSINSSNTINITAGALTLQNANALSDAGTLNLTDGTTLNLGAGTGTTETINGLQLNGAPVPAGTYSASDLTSRDANITFTGDETLLVLTTVPEPTTILGSVLLVGVAAWNQRRRLRGSVSLPA